MVQNLLKDLQQPEYVHILLNPLPVYGLAMGLLAMMVALATRSIAARRVGLVLLFVGGASFYPVQLYGHKGYDRVLSMADEEGGQWLKVHMERAERVEILFYALALLAVAGLLAPLRFPKTELPLAIVALTLGLIAMGAGGWIAYAGGKVRHSEIRNEPPPAVGEEHDHEH